jgi:hypothetical protein
MSNWFYGAPHVEVVNLLRGEEKRFNWLTSYLCGVFTGHRACNWSDGRIHYAYCKWCYRMFGHPWDGGK